MEHQFLIMNWISANIIIVEGAVVSIVTYWPSKGVEQVTTTTSGRLFSIGYDPQMLLLASSEADWVK